MGYSVATFERIWVNVIRILYLVCTKLKNVSILPVLEWVGTLKKEVFVVSVLELVFSGRRLLPFPLFIIYNARPTTRSPRHASPPYSECREDSSHGLHFCPFHTYRSSTCSLQTMQKGPSCPISHNASPCVALPTHCLDVFETVPLLQNQSILKNLA
jgi:hypothetical protein